MARRRRRKNKNTEQGDLLAGAALEGPAPLPEEVEPVAEEAPPETEVVEPVAEEPVPEAEEAAETVLPEPPDEPTELELTMEGEGEVEESDEVPTIPDSAWEQKMAWAKERVREGKTDEALELYRELVDEDPSSVRARNNLGVLLDEEGQHLEAVKEFRTAQSLDPSNLEVLGNLGAALGALGRYPEAEEVLRGALRADPTSMEVRANLGILFFRRGLYEQAEVELRAVCRENPDHGPAFFYRGEALNRLGRVSEAVESLERAIALIPGNPRAHYTLGILFDKQMLPDRAAEMYRKARELSDR
jgi:Flp pilus assembly protein TadD